MNIDKLKTVMSQSLPDNVLRGTDNRSRQQPPWKGEPFKGHKKRYPTNQGTEVSEDDDAYNLEEGEEDEDEWGAQSEEDPKSSGTCR